MYGQITHELRGVARRGAVRRDDVTTESATTPPDPPLPPVWKAQSNNASLPRERHPCRAVPSRAESKTSAGHRAAAGRYWNEISSDPATPCRVAAGRAPLTCTPRRAPPPPALPRPALTRPAPHPKRPSVHRIRRMYSRGDIFKFNTSSLRPASLAAQRRHGQRVCARIIAPN